MIRPNILVNTSRPVDPNTFAIMGAYQNDDQITAVIIKIAAKSKICILILWEIDDANRIMVDMVPGPVVNGMAIGITAVEMICERLGLSI